MSVLLGNGDGSFQAPVSYDAGGGPSGVRIGRFLSASSLDVAVTTFFSLNILIGNGNGTLQSAPHYSTGSGSQPASAALGDFNNDGKIDAVVADENSNQYSILLGNGDGTFQQAANHPTSSIKPDAVSTADFNGDGKLDLAIGNLGPGSVGNVEVLLGNGDGTFQNPVKYAISGQPNAVAAADLNGNGRIDLVVSGGANSTGTSVNVLLGNGDGTFRPAVSYNALSVPGNVVVADVNQDGKPDLVVANGASNGPAVSVFLGNGDGTFQPAVGSGSGIENATAALADFNGDGKVDVAVAGFFSVQILLGNGDGTFGSPVTYNVGSAARSLVASDVNGDGRPDLVVATYGGSLISVLLGNGDGTFQGAVGVAGGAFPVSLAAADLNGDNLPDLVVANTDSNNVSVFLNPGASGSSAPGHP